MFFIMMKKVIFSSAKSDREMEIQENRRRKALMSTTSNMSRSSDPLKNPGMFFEDSTIKNSIWRFIYNMSFGLFYLLSKIVLGWQIIRTCETSSEEFVMIYDLWIDQPDNDEEADENSKKRSGNNSSFTNAKHNKGSEDVFEE